MDAGIIYIACIENMGMRKTLFHPIPNSLNSIVKIQLHSGINQMKTPGKTFCGFHKGRHLHHIIRHAGITTQRVILFVLSIGMICYMESHFIYIIDLNDALP